MAGCSTPKSAASCVACCTRLGCVRRRCGWRRKLEENARCPLFFAGTVVVEEPADRGVVPRVDAWWRRIFVGRRGRVIASGCCGDVETKCCTARLGEQGVGGDSGIGVVGFTSCDGRRSDAGAVCDVGLGEVGGEACAAELCAPPLSLLFALASVSVPASHGRRMPARAAGARSMRSCRLEQGKGRGRRG